MSRNDKICPECGKPNDMTSKYCIHCGAPLEEVVTATKEISYAERLGAGSAIDKTFSIYKNLFVVLVIFASLSPIVSMILNVFVDITITLLFPQISDILNQINNVSPTPDSYDYLMQLYQDLLNIILSPEFIITIGLLLILNFIISSVVSAITGASVVQITYQNQTQDKQDFDIFNIIDQVKGKIWSIIGSQILAVLIILGFTIGFWIGLIFMVFILAGFGAGSLMSLLLLGGLIFFFVGIFYLAIRFSILTQIIVVEDTSAMEAISLSGDRVNGYKWSYLGLSLIIIVITLILGLFTPFFTRIAGSIGSRFYNTVISILIFPIGVIARTLLYLNKLARDY